MVQTPPCCGPMTARQTIDSDGLHYKFELRIFVEKPEDAVKMQTLSIDQKVDK